MTRKLPAALVLIVVAGLILVFAYYLNRQPSEADPEVGRKHGEKTESGGKPHHDPIQYRAKDARPAIVEPTFVSAKEAKIAGGTKGIGVNINGDSRFYPLYVLQYHQVVNDVCGDSAIACSY